MSGTRNKGIDTEDTWGENYAIACLLAYCGMITGPIAGYFIGPLLGLSTTVSTGGGCIASCLLYCGIFACGKCCRKKCNCGSPDAKRENVQEMHELPSMKQ